MHFIKKTTKKNDEELTLYPITGKVQSWYFRINEISQGYYRVEGVDKWGRIVSRDGADPDELPELCADDVKEIAEE